MKKFILVLSVLILFSFECSAQDTLNTKQKVTNDFLKINKTPNHYLVDAANEFEVAYISGVAGCALTGILMTVSLNQKNVDRIKDLNTFVYTPFVVGTIISIVEFLNGTSDLKKAGKYYYK